MLLTYALQLLKIRRTYSKTVMHTTLWKWPQWLGRLC